MPAKKKGVAVPRAAKAKTPEPTDKNGRISVMIEMQATAGGSPAHALGLGESMSNALPGFQMDPKFEPVTMGGAAAPGMSGSPSTFIVRGTVKSEKEIEELKAQPGVAAVWKDTPIDGFVATGGPTLSVQNLGAGTPCPISPCDCAPGVAKGSIADVATYLGVDQIWSAGFRGTGIVVGVLDSGITAVGRTLKAGEAPTRLISRVVAGWPEDDWGTESSKWGYHGNMCATDVLGMAPEAQLYDLRIAGAGGSPGTISRALQAFQWAINRHRSDGTPQVLTNSWGIFMESWDPTYARDANHPFTRKVVEAINEGILVLFAAGNCGGTCPDGRCGADNGPGKSIWGANGHPRVITVGAVNKNEQFIGYSSQGPAALDPNKPDFCSVSHFQGYFPSDNGTSAATPIAAGVVALLKQSKATLTQDACKAALKASAKDIGPAGEDQHTGAGILRARAALDRVRGVTDPIRDLVVTRPAVDAVTLPFADTSPIRDRIGTSPAADIVWTNPIRDEPRTLPQIDFRKLPARDLPIPGPEPRPWAPGPSGGQAPFVLASPHQAPGWEACEPSSGTNVAALEAEIQDTIALLDQQHQYLNQLTELYQALVGGTAGS